VGRIAGAARSDGGRTPLQARLDRLATLLLRAASAVCVGLAAAAWAHGESLADSVMIGISLAVAAVPEGLPAVVTIVLAVGMQRLAARGAIVRRLQAVETLGSTTVICTDKTGTLTENRMALARMFICDGELELALADGLGEARAHELVGTALVASGPEALDAGAPVPDPIEAAIARVGADMGLTAAALLDGGRIVQVEPFDSERKRMSVVVEAAGGAREAAVKGAPEAIVERLSPTSPFAGERLEEIAARWSESGLRVLLIGRSGTLAPGADPEAALHPVGLLGFADPPRPGVRESVEEARAAGVRTVMITGDHPRTALAIARATGIAGEDGAALTGAELDELTDEELARRVRSVSAFARVVPQHKVRIVDALRRNGEIVGMTGDGVNDVPALTAADIGVAMGMRGTDAAAAAGDIVLTDDDYSTIVRAVREGRTIYDNILRFTHFLLAANVGEVLVFAVAILAGMSAPLTVVQILMVNLLTDGLPAVALGADPPDRDVMRRPPRPPRQGLLDPLRGRLALGGLALGAAAFASFAVGYATSQELGRTMAFTTLVFGQLAYVYSVRGESSFLRAGRNPLLHAAVALSAAVQALVLALPGLSERFGVVAMGPDMVAVALALAAVPLAASELAKAIRRSARGTVTV
jgi:Ca2+-transporting ATPase